MHPNRTVHIIYYTRLNSLQFAEFSLTCRYFCCTGHRINESSNKDLQMKMLRFKLELSRATMTESTRHAHSNLPSQKVVFPVHCTTFVPAILSHFLSIDPLNSYPL